MNQMDHLKYIAIGRSYDQAILLELIPNKDNKIFLDEVCIYIIFPNLSLLYICIYIYMTYEASLTNDLV